MTAIAYRAGLMACDSCWTYGSTQVESAIKITRLRSGALLGQAGDNDARAILDLLQNIRNPDKLPARGALAETKCDFIGLLALPKGGVFCIATGKVDEMGFPADDEEDFGVWRACTMGGYAAVGSGAEAALAAMDAGADARRAVDIACRRNINCRPPIHVLRLKPKESLR